MATAAAATGARKAAAPVLLLDFDHSLIDANSDPWIVSQLRPELSEVMRALRKQPEYQVWTLLMDEMMRRLHEAGIRKEEMEATLRKLPMHPGMKRMVTRAHELGFELYIVSDANAVFIRCGLEGLYRFFAPSNIFTNPAHFDGDGRPHVRPFHDLTKPHHCPHCPQNMCKGSIVRHILEEYRRRHDGAKPPCTLYLGDGSGDLCPSLQLDESDAILARKDYPLAALLRERDKEPRARVFEWADGDEAERIFLAEAQLARK